MSSSSNDTGSDGFRVALLGCGRQGLASLWDLYQWQQIAHIVVIDADPLTESRLGSYASDRVSVRTMDISNKAAVSEILSDVDLVVEALPGLMALSAAELAVAAGVHIVSSMYLLNPGESDASRVSALRARIADVSEQGKRAGVTILPEFGLDPGIDLVLSAQAVSEFDEVHEFLSYGAGLPDEAAKDNPLKYRFSWTPIGVMLSYNRPATVVRGGSVKRIPARSIFEKENIHEIDVDGFDEPLECFPNGDGVYYARLLGIEKSVQEMGRYACRYPGHCRFWEAASKSGFLSGDPIDVGGTSLSPLTFTTALLSGQEQFRFDDDQRDMTILRVDVTGLRNRERAQIRYQMIDHRDLETGFSSMQRTVGFMMSLGARLILDGTVEKRGIVQPSEVRFADVQKGLSVHGIEIIRSEVSPD